jgi:uncharacterized RDD family membrane protein YckC
MIELPDGSGSGASGLNPYAAPKADLELAQEAGEYEFEYGGRLARLLARIIDGIICGIPFGLIRYFLLPDRSTDLFRQNRLLYALIVGGASFLVWELIYFLVNFHWLKRDGQTLGKGICGIKIVREDGSPANLMDVYVKRELPKSFIGQIPVINFAVIVDALFVFSSERRTLHDLLAGTIVVDIGSWRIKRKELKNLGNIPSIKRLCPYCAERYSEGALVCPSCERDLAVKLSPEAMNTFLSNPERLRKANRLFAWGDYKEALELYERVVKEDPDCLDAWLCLLTSVGVRDELKQQARKNVQRIRSAQG